MQFVTAIFDSSTVLSPLERDEVKNLIEFKLSRYAQDIARVQFRIFKVIGDQLTSEYLAQVIVQMKSGRRIVVDAGGRHSVSAIRSALDQMKAAVARRIALESWSGIRLFQRWKRARRRKSGGGRMGRFPTPRASGLPG